MIRRRSRIWLGIGTSVLVAPALASPYVEPLAAIGSGTTTLTGSAWMLDKAPANLAAPLWRVAEGAGGEGGEGGAGGEGGEAGIDPESADRDPVAWGVALGVIEAHYHAGLMAYVVGETEAGGQMFAHGLSEVYSVMEPVFVRRGVSGLGAMLQATVDLAVAKAPPAAVQAQVGVVLAALSAAVSKGPTGEDAAAVHARVVVELIDRAAAQYAAASTDKTLEPFLDGLGFSAAAQRGANSALTWLAKRDAGSAAAVRTALELAARAYPGAKRPGTPTVNVGEFLAAASAAKLSISRLK